MGATELSAMTLDKGAHYYRCDFQVHTPRDARWKGKRFTTDAERRSYATSFVEACRRVGLQAVAITDHHDLLFAPLIRAAAKAETNASGRPVPEHEQLVVFPGVELTLGVPCQALLILDANFPDDRLPAVLEALAIQVHDENETSLPSEVTRLDHINSLSQLCTELNNRPWLRDRYIILPNVTDAGHGSIVRKGMQSRYKEMRCVGAYLDGSIEKLGTGATAILSGKDHAWGNKRLALFQTSDCRSETFSNLGIPSTWVKWAEPTAEALRQACLAQESRISQVEPRLPSVFISQLVVSNSKFFGPVDLELNPQYNALIGGRGTGKSTLLGYLRWALCDQPIIATGDDELADPRVRMRRLIQETLAPYDAQVEVHFTINEIRHIVRRSAGTGDILLKVGDSEFSKASESDIRALLPVHAYSQKQLSSVSIRLDELARFVTAPIQQQLDTIDRQINDVSGRMRENYATLQRTRDLDASIARLKFTEKSLADQANSLRASLQGLSDADRTLLDMKPTVDSLREKIAAWDRTIDGVMTAGMRLVGDIDEALAELAPVPDVPISLREQVEVLREETSQSLITLRAAIDQALTGARYSETSRGPDATNREAVNDALKAFDSQYEEVKRRSTSHEGKVKELSDLEARRQSTSTLLSGQERERRDLGDPQHLHSELRATLASLYRERSECLSEQCHKLTVLSDNLLRAQIQRGRGLDEPMHKFRSLIAGSGVRGSRIDALFSSLAQETDPLATWEEVLRELERLLLMGDNGELTSEMTPVLTRLDFSLADQRRIRPKLTPDGWLDLALTPISDQPMFQYQTKDKEFIEFSSASAGQQATALLFVLLAQTGMPLMIDQPEEDLDSQIVVEVVDRIWRAKSGRQLIFASHNANLVVNGDAELLVACDYRRSGDQSGGKINIEGAIDVPVVRREITQVMEGGEKAFKLRKEKYGF
jgi:predicted  nucleic acid-binding Zn-ribbon protein